jgi:hypothetical protein
MVWYGMSVLCAGTNMDIVTPNEQEAAILSASLLIKLTISPVVDSFFPAGLSRSAFS